MKIRLLMIVFAISVIATPTMADMYGTVDVLYKGLVLGYDELQLFRGGA